eukprot:365973-Chlamydomonas_euryale.AAC.5
MNGGGRNLGRQDGESCGGGWWGLACGRPLPAPRFPRAALAGIPNWVRSLNSDSGSDAQIPATLT